MEQTEETKAATPPVEWTMTELEHEQLLGTIKDTTIIQQQRELAMGHVAARQAAWAKRVGGRLGIDTELVVSGYDMDVGTGKAKLRAPPDPK